MLWKEFQMLLSNDAVEGSEVEQLEEADRVYLSLKSHMRRLREQLKIQPDEQQHIEPIDASPEFQNDLAAIWERYLAIQKELASDKFEEARRMLTSFESSVAELDDSTLEGHAAHVWKREHANLDKLIAALKTADEIEVMRARFKPLSEEIGFLAKSFGFGEAGPIYEIHCPMAFEGKGALWYQENDLVRNPYYGASMLKCADRVEKIIRDEPELNEEERDHSQHDHSQD
jgi:Cu(I)/Ag(I) efflux system membrane fusion protein